MTPTRLRECLETLGWSQRELARQIGCRVELAQRWARGAVGYDTPPAVAEWLERRVRAACADPPPADWRRPPLGRARDVAVSHD